MFWPRNQELARAWKFPAPRPSAGFSRLTQKILTECKYFSNPNILPMQIKVLRKSKEDLQAESKRELETTRAGNSVPVFISLLSTNAQTLIQIYT
jgi:hypothetical protein